MVDKMTGSTPTQVENEYGFLISGKYLAKFNETQVWVKESMNINLSPIFLFEDLTLNGLK